jgi:hypothetical protein
MEFIGMGNIVWKNIWVVVMDFKELISISSIEFISVDLNLNYLNLKNNLIIKSVVKY